MQKQRRQTKQRRVILEELQRSRSHPTAEELYFSLKDEVEKLSLATVYRNLDRLVEDGLIKMIETPEGARRYDGDLSEHYHLKCRRCGAIVDLHSVKIPELPDLFSAESGVLVESLKIEFQGLCSSCLRREDEALPESPR